MITTILGSCANQISDREGVAILIENKDTNLLIDCGPGIVSAIGKARKKASDINNVLLTHVHGDHVTGFPYFVWNRNFERMGANNTASDLHVYGMKDTIEYAKFSIQAAYPELKFPFEIIYHVLNENDKFSCANLNVEVFGAIHTVPNLSCIIKDSDKTIVYSSDTLPNELLIEKGKNCDFLIHEGMMTEDMNMLAKKVMHSTAKDAGVVAKKMNAKQLALVHIAPGLLGKENLLLEQAKEEYDGMITIPYDGTVFII